MHGSLKYSEIDLGMDYKKIKIDVKKLREKIDQLSVLEMIQKLETIQDITDPAQRAEMYKKVFGECCETAQTQIVS